MPMFSNLFACSSRLAVSITRVWTRLKPCSFCSDVVKTILQTFSLSLFPATTISSTNTCISVVDGYFENLSSTFRRRPCHSHKPATTSLSLTQCPLIRSTPLTITPLIKHTVSSHNVSPCFFGASAFPHIYYRLVRIRT